MNFGNFEVRTRSGARIALQHNHSNFKFAGTSMPVSGTVLTYENAGMGLPGCPLEAGETKHWTLDGKFTLNAEDPRDLILTPAELAMLRAGSPLATEQSNMNNSQTSGMGRQQSGTSPSGAPLPKYPVAKLTAVQASIINNARKSNSGKNDEERRQIKREVFSTVRSKFNLPSVVKLKANTDNADSPTYLLLKDSKTERFLGVDSYGRYSGKQYSFEELFPPAAPAPQQLNPAAAWPFPNKTAAPEVRQGWFRLDAEAVAEVLIADNFADASFGFDHVPVDIAVQGTPTPPEPYLMLAGTEDLCVASDGGIYRKFGV